jgi:protein phosphatase
MAARGDVTVGQVTHTGLLREENQDALTFYEPEERRSLKRQGRLLVVADGVGGHPGGDTAAHTAIDCIRDSYSKSDGADPATALKAAFTTANRAIHRLSKEEKGLGGMGTTCTALVIRAGEAWFAHVGDSRAYLMRGRKIHQLTRDHSAAWSLFEQGKITKEEYERHPKARVIQRSLGFQARVRVDLAPRPIPVRKGDIFLLCSDGLTGVVTEQEILRTATQYSPQEACRRLVARANQRGGPDNITVQIARVHRVPGSSRRRPKGKAT